VLLAVASIIFARNQPNRHFIHGQLQTSTGWAISVPGRQFSYGAADLNAFKDFLQSKDKSASETVLQFYIRPTLIWNDIIFAAEPGGFVVVSWLG
jgi:hypothetical protein